VIDTRTEHAAERMGLTAEQERAAYSNSAPTLLKLREAVAQLDDAEVSGYYGPTPGEGKTHDYAHAANCSFRARVLLGQLIDRHVAALATAVADPGAAPGAREGTK